MPSHKDIEDHFTAALDVDFLRTMQHLCEERAAMIKARRPIHLRPQVEVVGPAAEEAKK